MEGPSNVLSFLGGDQVAMPSEWIQFARAHLLSPWTIPLQCWTVQTYPVSNSDEWSHVLPFSSFVCNKNNIINYSVVQGSSSCGPLSIFLVDAKRIKRGPGIINWLVILIELLSLLMLRFHSSSKTFLQALFLIIRFQAQILMRKLSNLEIILFIMHAPGI